MSHVWIGQIKNWDITRKLLLLLNYYIPVCGILGGRIFSGHMHQAPKIKYCPPRWSFLPIIIEFNVHLYNLLHFLLKNYSKHCNWNTLPISYIPYNLLHCEDGNYPTVFVFFKEEVDRWDLSKQKTGRLWIKLVF